MNEHSPTKKNNSPICQITTAHSSAASKEQPDVEIDKLIGNLELNKKNNAKLLIDVDMEYSHRLET